MDSFPLGASRELQKSYSKLVSRQLGLLVAQREIFNKRLTNFESVSARSQTLPFPAPQPPSTV